MHSKLNLRSAGGGAISALAVLCCAAALLVAPASAATKHKHHKHAATTHPSSGSAKGKLTHGRGGKTRRTRGQQKIDSERARQIQEALVREHYLSGDANKDWDQSSEAAMRRFQADHGWQTKTVPDARALIALGLGPKQDHLLNPESAMTTAPMKNASAVSQPAPAAHSQKQ